jgi:hypothetical protein
MSYSVTFRDGSIAVRASAKPAALRALISLAAAGITGDDVDRLDSAVLRASTLETALRAFGWDSSSDTTGDIVHAWMIGDELGYSEDMFRALAPHIEPGSYAEFIGEDRDIWRWRFDGRHVIETYPDFVWPTTPTGGWARACDLLRARVTAFRARRRAAL